MQFLYLIFVKYFYQIVLNSVQRGREGESTTNLPPYI